jgi:hypothetical protein
MLQIACHFIGKPFRQEAVTHAPLYNKLKLICYEPHSIGKVHAMKSDEAEQLVREFLKANPQHTKTSLSIDSDARVQVIPGIARLEDLKEMRLVPSDAQWLADIDEEGNIRVFSRHNVFEEMYFAMMDYHFGNMNFIELLNKWSDLLGIEEPPLDTHRPTR